MKNKASIFFGLLFLATSIAQSQHALTPETLWDMGRVSDAQVSPDNKTVLYGVTYYDVAENNSKRSIYTMPVAGGEEKKIIDLKTSVYNARWRPDGKKIGFLSARSGSMQLWEVNPDGTASRQVTSFDGGIQNFSYAPDMKHISFTMDVKLDEDIHDKYPDLPAVKARLIDDLMYRHWNSWHDYKYSHVFYVTYNDGRVEGKPVDIMEGEKHDCPLNPFGGTEHITWSPDGKQILYVSKKEKGKAYAESTNSDLYLYSLETGETRNITAGMNGYDLDPVFSPDGQTIAWLSMARAGFEADKSVIYLYDMTTGTKTALTQNMDASASHLVWAEDGSKIYFTSGVNATYQVFEVDLSFTNTDGLPKDKVQALTQGYHNYYSLAKAGDHLVGLKASMSMPHELFTVSLKSSEESKLTHTNQKIMDQLTTGEVKKRMVKTSDGKDMLVWVIYPPNFDPEKKYPALLYCQGGPQSAVSQFFSYRWNFQLMAAHGYIIVAPNRRGLPTFGQEWNDQISGDWGGQAMKDYLAAIDDVAKEPYVDADRLGAVGASYGGYSVYYLAGIHEKRFKAFISHCGLFNMESWYGSTEEMFFANWDLKGAYWKTPRPATYDQFSPHRFVQNWDTPILVIHNEKDFRVPVNQGIEAFNAAQLRGIPSRFLYMPDEGHWVLKPQNGILWQRVFFEWLDTYLK